MTESIDPARLSRWSLGRRGWTVLFVVLGVILVAAIVLAVSLVLPPNLDPVPIPSVSAA